MGWCRACPARPVCWRGRRRAWAEHNDEVLGPVLGAGEVARLRGIGVVRDTAARKAAE